MSTKRKYGWSAPAHKDPRDWKYTPHRGLTATLPVAADLRTTNFLPPVYDQGQLGSCGPNSASRILYFNEAKEGKKNIQVPSRLFIYWVTRSLMGTVNEDSGVDNSTMLKAINKWGFCGENLMPYADDPKTFLKRPTSAEFAVAWHEKVTSYLSVAQDATTMKACLASGFPFIVGFTVYESFESDAVAKTGVVPMPEKGEQVLGGHDITVVGYDDAKQVWICQNSWGPDWGMKGSFVIPYAYYLNPQLAGDFWTIRQVP